MVLNGSSATSKPLALWQSERGATMEDLKQTLIAALTECEDYFDQRADADCDQDGFIPNEEMKLLQVVREAIAKAEGRS